MVPLQKSVHFYKLNSKELPRLNIISLLLLFLEIWPNNLPEMSGCVHKDIPHVPVSALSICWGQMFSPRTVRCLLWMLASVFTCLCIEAFIFLITFSVLVWRCFLSNLCQQDAPKWPVLWVSVILWGVPSSKGRAGSMPSLPLWCWEINLWTLVSQMQKALLIMASTFWGYCGSCTAQRSKCWLSLHLFKNVNLVSSFL